MYWRQSIVPVRSSSSTSPRLPPSLKLRRTGRRGCNLDREPPKAEGAIALATAARSAELWNWKIRPSGSSALPAIFALMALAWGQSAQGDSKPTAVPAASPYAIVSNIGETVQQLTLKDGKLLAHRRTTDPFGIAIRGKFKGLPPVAERSPVPANSPAASNKPAVVIGELTLEKAVQQLPIGAVNVANREALIGFRAIHEGDLLVLELSGHQFVVWVQSIDRRGVQFCDITLQQHVLKPFRFGPNELPENATGTQTEVRDFLKQDVH
jgi:hypothetical protein